MRSSPLLLVLVAGATTFGISQALTPTAQAQESAGERIAGYQVQVQSLHTTRTAAGLEVTGHLVNAGRQTLTYISVAVIFTDKSGKEVARADGYLTAGPLLPGQSADLRAVTPPVPAYAAIGVRLREAGHPIIAEMPRVPVAGVQASESRPITVW